MKREKVRNEKRAEREREKVIEKRENEGKRQEREKILANKREGKLEMIRE